MVDFADNTDASEEKLLEFAITAARTPVTSQKPTGFCFNCDEIVAAGRRFCDADCAADYEKAQKAKSRGL